MSVKIATAKHRFDHAGTMLRAACKRGDMADDDLGWLHNHPRSQDRPLLRAWYREPG